MTNQAELLYIRSYTKPSSTRKLFGFFVTVSDLEHKERPTLKNTQCLGDVQNNLVKQRKTH